MLGADTTTGASLDLLLAMLEADPNLGCCPDVYWRHRTSLDVRRAIAQQHINPTIVYHDLNVDYSDPDHRRIKRHEYYRIHDALTDDQLVNRRSGQARVRMAEICTDCSLSVACQQRLLRVLGYEAPCLAEARQLMNTTLAGADYPVMAHFGAPFTTNGGTVVLPCLHQVELGRFLEANQLNCRYAQTYRLLAIVPPVAA